MSGLQTPEVILEVDAGTRYRRMTRQGELATKGRAACGDYMDQRECDRKTGHVLQVGHCGRIVCRNCNAEWRDMRH